MSGVRASRSARIDLLSPTSDRLPGTPLIRLTGAGGMAGVVIRHLNHRERRKPHGNPHQD